MTAADTPVFARVSGARRVKNNVATGFVVGSVLVALVPLVWLLWTVIGKGAHVVAKASWWTGTQRNKTFTDSGGGVLHAIVGTLEQVAICTLISVPVAVLVGVYLIEYGRGPIARTATFMVDILTGIPSIVAALFIYAVFIASFGLRGSGWLVSLALVILMIPVVVRTTEEMLRLVPNELREASYALGVPKWKTIVRVVLPTAFTGLITGVILGIARVAGETAPLLILVGYSQDMNTDPFKGAQGTLPGMIYDQFNNLIQAKGTGAYHLDANGNRVAGAVANFAPERMWGTALTLILIVLLLNLIARFVGRFSKIAE
ncbi:MAG TPA: phosphate ABC transporter permease PstA [Jatrophihabitantaceae bacterium]|nr:phosphate ABC transporter permease PstA [Jatrophihabitantaceae bacterium]